MNMNIFKLVSIALLLTTVVVLTACGNAKDEPDTPEVITRVKDSDGKVFIENSKMIVATTAFTNDQVREALTSAKWIRAYDLLYDKDHVSGKTSLTENQFPVAFVGGNKAVFPLEISRSFSLSGKTITIARDILSSTYHPDDNYNIVALDYNGTVKRIITDKFAAGFTSIPEGYDFKTTYIRTIWISE